MPITKYIYMLSDAQIGILNHIITSDLSSEREVRRAKIILYSAINAPEKMTTRQMVNFLHVSIVTISEVRKQFCEEGIEFAVYRKKKSPGKRPPKLTLEIEKQILNMLKGPVPKGHKKWSLRLAADEAAKRGIVSVSHSTIRDIMDKYGFTLS